MSSLDVDAFCNAQDGAMDRGTTVLSSTLEGDRMFDIGELGIATTAEEADMDSPSTMAYCETLRSSITIRQDMRVPWEL